MPLLTSAAISAMDCSTSGGRPNSDSGNQRSNSASWVFSTSAALMSADGVCARADDSSATAIAAANALKNCLRLRADEGKNESSCIASLPEALPPALRCPTSMRFCKRRQGMSAVASLLVRFPGKRMVTPRDFNARITRRGPGAYEPDLEIIIRGRKH